MVLPACSRKSADLLGEADVDGYHADRSDDHTDEQTSCAAIGETEHGGKEEDGPGGDYAAVDADEAGEAVESAWYCWREV